MYMYMYSVISEELRLCTCNTIIIAFVRQELKLSSYMIGFSFSPGGSEAANMHIYY